MIVLHEKAKEKKSYAIAVPLTGIDGVDGPPVGLTWTLSDQYGTVINSRSDVVATPGDPTVVLLEGNDLALNVGVGNARIVTVEGTYSTTLGVLSFGEDILFRIDDLKAVT